MSKIDQLILDVGEYAILLPESKYGGYEAYEETLSIDLTMLPGNMVKEIRGSVWHVNYQYGYFSEDMKNNILAACRKGQKEPIICAFLPPDGNELVNAEFFVTGMSTPKFQWSAPDRNGVSQPIWADFSVQLREVEPHD